MGYDDNTPLSGVTGGSLPAEIWRETMVRVHQDVPARALPMQAPPSGPQVATEARPRRSNNSGGDNLVERVILDVLGEIFGN